jgi:hypothetical protein
MVSADHFAQELRAQFKKAVAQGAARAIITSGELYGALGGDAAGSMQGMPACCEAMCAEMKPGDNLLAQQVNGGGMTVCYRLPRPH